MSNPKGDALITAALGAKVSPDGLVVAPISAIRNLVGATIAQVLVDVHRDANNCTASRDTAYGAALLIASTNNVYMFSDDPDPDALDAKLRAGLARIGISPDALDVNLTV